MSPYVVGGLIAAGSALLVWILTAVRDHWTEKQRQLEQRRTDLRAALSNYLAALDSLMLEALQEAPDPPFNAVDRVIEFSLRRTGIVAFLRWLGIQQIVVWAERVVRWIGYGRRPETLHDRMAQASAELRLIAPPEVLHLMEHVDDFIFGRVRPEAWKAEWTSTRAAMQDGFRKALEA